MAVAGGLLDLLGKKMGYLTQRSAVLADNISNANTPKFQPHDLVSFDQVLSKAQSSTGGATGGLQMVSTNPGHMGGTHGTASPYKVQTEKDTYEMKPSGNSVVLEQQMNELSQTYTDYSMVIGLYHKTVGLIKTALSHGS